MGLKILELGKYYPPYYLGGVELYTKQCAELLAQENEVYCLTFSGEKKSYREKMNGVNLIRVGSFFKFRSQEITFELKKIINEIQPDLIHFHAPNPLAMFSMMMNKKKYPYFVTHHTDIVKQKILGKIVRPFYHDFLKKSLSIISYSHHFAKTSQEISFFQDKIAVIPYGLDFEEFNRVKEEDVNEFRKKISSGKKTIGFIGRQVRYKGVQVLLRAVAMLPEVQLVVIGDGPELEANKKLADELKISGRVFFLGSVPHEKISAFFKTIDIFILPSINSTETFGHVLVEAQLSKVPIIASDVQTGVNEICMDGKTGLLVRPNDSFSLSDAIKKLIQDEAIKKSLIAQAFDHARHHFTLAITEKKFLEHVKEISYLSHSSLVLKEKKIA